MSIIDLHMHSTYSDGTLSVEDLVELAYQNGVQYLSLTDHDTVIGIPEAIDACAKRGMTLIPGVELSVHVENEEVHLLAYNFDWKDKKFSDFLEDQKADRTRRLNRILENLEKVGVQLKEADVLEFLEDGTAPGRPHIARALVKVGAVKDIQDAFDKYLKKGKPAYEKRQIVEAKEILTWVHELGGFTSLAHPGLIKRPENIERMIEWGVQALEIFHPDHPNQKREKFASLAQQHQIQVTAGSDFHDKNYHHGIGPGCFDLPEEVSSQLIATLTY